MPETPDSLLPADKTSRGYRNSLERRTGQPPVFWGAANPRCKAFWYRMPGGEWQKGESSLRQFARRHRLSAAAVGAAVRGKNGGYYRGVWFCRRRPADG